MIKKKINQPQSIQIALEERLAKNFIKDRRYIVLNEFVTEMRLTYDLSYTNERAIELLERIGLYRKRISFVTKSGIKHSKNEFVNERCPDDIRPIVEDFKTHDETIEKVAISVLNFIKDNFAALNFTKGIINFNLYEENETGSKLLIFDNQNLKEVLRLVMNNFSYKIDFIPRLASKIRSLSESSYLRENEYSEKSVRVADKKFYSYSFAEKKEKSDDGKRN